MGRKIFITYKYADNKVFPINQEETTARKYVDELQELLKHNNHINKGEVDDTDLSQFKDDTIQNKLRARIFDSTLTLVMISKGMKDPSLPENDQWMPWEISYSLKNKEREGRGSLPNAMLAVVLPDEDGLYSYYITDDSCPHCKCRILKTYTLFNILKVNMFNIKTPSYNDCIHHDETSKIYTGNSSYIYSVKWCDFISKPDFYLDKAMAINEDIDSYDIKRSVV
ncbi:TIR domain-containing protein [Enterobacter roggenkampii]|uniref:TIR domain-containing protein n=1 Tax=Enterobacter roggenkampii TaxID=1812935 RepID=UPI0020044F0F|nr:TIR domain-containing protein [Enterobacter roggenkampii]MCK7118902.1 TIR domain-containing protein [Enterobacter roggenkampii]